jgi:hypothetical protein
MYTFLCGKEQYKKTYMGLSACSTPPEIFIVKLSLPKFYLGYNNEAISSPKSIIKEVTTNSILGFAEKITKSESYFALEEIKMFVKHFSRSLQLILEQYY